MHGKRRKRPRLQPPCQAQLAVVALFSCPPSLSGGGGCGVGVASWPTLAAVGVQAFPRGGVIASRRPAYSGHQLSVSADARSLSVSNPPRGAHAPCLSGAVNQISQRSSTTSIGNLFQILALGSLTVPLVVTGCSKDFRESAIHRDLLDLLTVQTIMILSCCGNSS